MPIIVLYIIGFIFCIVANLLNNHFDKVGEFETSFVIMLVGLWLLSPITVPLSIFVSLPCGIGLLMKYLTKKLEKLIDKICM